MLISRYPDEDYADPLYRGNSDYNNNNSHEDQLRLYTDVNGNRQQQFIGREEQQASGRNFAWEDEEKKKKKS